MELSALDEVMVEYEYSPAELIALVVSTGRKVTKKLLADACRDCVEEKRKSGKRKNYIRKLKSHLDSLALIDTSLLCSEITREQIESWARRPYGLEQKPPSPYTVRARLIDAGTLFAFCKKKRYCHADPTEHIETILIDDKPPGILTIDQCQTLLKRCLKMDRGYVPYLAIQMFAGLRPEEARRVVWANIGEKYIEVTSAISKTRKRRLVEIQPNLRAWLDLGGDLPVKNYWRRSRVVRSDYKLGLKGKKHWKLIFPMAKDCVRHSFCSYHLAQFQSASKTAFEAGHSEHILFKHYRELVRPEEAAKFWQITPDSLNKNS